MRKLILGFLFLVMMSLPGMANDETYYCYNSSYNFVYKETSKERNNPVYKNPSNRCEREPYAGSYDVDKEIPKNVYDKFQNTQSERRNLSSSMVDKGEFKKRAGLFGFVNDSDKMKSFGHQTEQILHEVINTSKVEIEEYNRNRAQIVKQEQDNKRKLEAELKRKKDLERVAILEKDFGKSCRSHSKGSEQYNNCLLEQERIAKEAEAKKLAAKQDQERKKLEVDLAKKRDLEAKAKEEQLKFSRMNPDDKRAYNCSEKFGFRKGSDKFKDCVFKIYQAEIELEKLELQRELAKANAETARVRAEAARASEERQQSLARAQTEAATMQALAARQQAIAANTASSLQMIESGLRMMSPQSAPAPRLQTNCFYHARSLSCF